jgi:hypothetical protein
MKKKQQEHQDAQTMRAVKRLEKSVSRLPQIRRGADQRKALRPHGLKLGTFRWASLL